MARQQQNGEWMQEAIEGVFNKSWWVDPSASSFFDTANMYDSMISYPNYKFTFTIKALGMFARLYGNPELNQT